MNRPDPSPPADWTALEQRLAGWQPAPAALNRDRLLFAAGVAAGRRQTNQRTVVLTAALGLVLGAWTLRERAERHRWEVVRAAQAPGASERKPPQPGSAAPAPAPDPGRVTDPEPSSYFALRQRFPMTDDDRSDRHARGPRRAPPAHRADDGLVLTPLSSRHPEDLAKL